MKVLVLSDLHCGARTGLTPPGWWYADEGDETSAQRRKWRHIQRVCWEWYAERIKAHGPYDVLIVNGDAIDGTGSRKGGIEQITTDRHEQVRMAAQCLRLAQRYKGGKLVTKTYVVRGTDYHTGTEEDFEDVLGYEVGAEKVGNQEFFDVDGVIFNCKHHIGSSSSPVGRLTALQRDRYWNLVWSADYEQAPRSDIIIRSHVHYAVDGGTPHWHGFTTPCLQTLGSHYGTRRCSGAIDYGFLVFHTNTGFMPSRCGTRWAWQYVTEPLADVAPQIVRV